MTTPAVRAIKRRYPHARLSWLVEGSVGELLTCQNFIDEVIQFPRGALQRSLKGGNLAGAMKTLGPFVGKLRESSYDLVLDFHGILKSAIFANLVKGRRRIGLDKTYAKEKSHLFYSEHVSGDNRRLHKVERNMLFPRYLGVNDPIPEAVLETSAEAEAYIDLFLASIPAGAPIFAINPFSSQGSRFKRWDMARYQELIGRITDEGAAHVIVVWGPGEEEEAKRLQAVSGDRVFLSCPTNVPQLFALLRRVEMYIGGDTGVMHLAAFAGKPVVAIFGPTDHKINAPFGALHQVVRKDLPCSPCKKKDCEERRCLKEIGVEEVFRRVLNLHRRSEKN
jgi:ADP-heptose:LPS heptosyltransferase